MFDILEDESELEEEHYGFGRLVQAAKVGHGAIAKLTAIGYRTVRPRCKSVRLMG